MFTTFSANSTATDDPSQKPASTASRIKRNQVARACDWCRLNRIKCDDQQPCQNCRDRGASCSKAKSTDVHSLPAANREIQRLRDRIKDMQKEHKNALEDARSQVQRATQYPTPSCSTSPRGGSPAPDRRPGSTRGGWEGIQNPDAQTGNVLYYGPQSASYYGTRMTRYLVESLSQHNMETQLPACVSRVRCPPRPLPEKAQLNDRSWVDGVSTRGGWDGGFLGSEETVEDLSRPQEEHFIALLWQSFHCVFPIISEKQFADYYDSLWTSPDLPRQSSALVDSLLAVCMQYGSAFLIGYDESLGNEDGSHATSASMAGYAFYRRAQQLSMRELEIPSVMALQSHIYCIIYLYNVSLMNTAHTLLGMAIRVAQTLRLHLKPLNGTSREQQDLHCRIWWSLYQLDSMLSMTLGRSPLLYSADASCDWPGDSEENTRLSGTLLLSSTEEDISWLSFYAQSVRLTSIVRGVQDAFNARCAKILQTSESQDIYETPSMVEELARFLGGEVRAVSKWAQDVPPSLQNRKGQGEPFSTGRGALIIDPCSPLWLQRQRILLELMYHHFQLTNFRPFVRFPVRPASLTPLGDSHTITCLNHAMAVTNILHQVLTETDLLRGWSPIFHYQWDAALCILGFLIGNPLCPPTPAARKCYQTAVNTLDIMGNQFAAARDSARVVQEIGHRAEMLIEKFRTGLTQRRSQSISPNAPPPDAANSIHSCPPVSSPGVTVDQLQAFLTSPGFDVSQSLALNNSNLLNQSDPALLDPERLMGMDPGSLSLPDNMNADMASSWINDNAMIMDFLKDASLA
ncbi:hypothetical protein P170DRAFT_434999 [Aspergillus steynii IBT 23096]|uniref:Zn(2)-C6 fungal-type domain-containing protein n=1 Tax=Aspergillus steynii IBT 23096 TaxID=1392250 RepID=A0A2I2GKH6_9EURO|nr:uncharacterized protein P170DRAFT_434999 [Aspergillus steynii IBT 23096]PLB53349.1 hypothetical protein P170DRAFT_434999 [Aspergillus steynii IBT 23096]